jgi:hypothetical protein
MHYYEHEIRHERVIRCKYCRSDMTDEVSSDSYQQNPYCHRCDAERTQNVVNERGETELCEVGGYLYLSPIEQTRP